MLLNTLKRDLDFYANLKQPGVGGDRQPGHIMGLVC